MQNQVTDWLFPGTMHKGDKVTLKAARFFDVAHGKNPEMEDIIQPKNRFLKLGQNLKFSCGFATSFS